MKRQLLFNVCVWLTAFAAPAVASADTIFSNFGAGFAYNASEGNVVGNAFDGNDYAEGDTFTPSSTVTFGSLRIALSCFSGCPAPDAFLVSLTVDNGDQPGTVLESFGVAGSSLGLFGAHNAPLVLNSAVKPLLIAGNQYWVTVAADAKDSIEWNLNSTGDPSDQAISTDNASTWFSPSGQTPGAYEVDSASSPVPEPRYPGLLLCIGVLGGIIRKFHRRLNSDIRQVRN
jgi:hypothetical protein